MPFFQAAHNGKTGETVSVFIDEMEIIPLDKVPIPRGNESHRIRDLLDLEAAYPPIRGGEDRTFISFGKATLANEGFVESPSTGYASSRYTLGSIPIDPSGYHTDGQGLAVTVAAKQGSLFYGPFVQAANHPVIIRASVRSSGPGAWLFGWFERVARAVCPAAGWFLGLCFLFG